jgi:hypothetical protein
VSLRLRWVWGPGRDATASRDGRTDWDSSGTLRWLGDHGVHVQFAVAFGKCAQSSKHKETREHPQYPKHGVEDELDVRWETCLSLQLQCNPKGSTPFLANKKRWQLTPRTGIASLRFYDLSAGSQQGEKSVGTKIL